MSTFGEKIFNLRKAKELTQMDLADLIGSSHAAIVKYEQNAMVPSLEVVVKIAQALGSTVSYLAGETTIPPVDQINLKRFKDIESLNQEEQKALFQVIDAFLRDAKQ